MARFWHKAYVTKFERLAYSPWMYSLKLSYLKKKREKEMKKEIVQLNVTFIVLYFHFI